MKTTQAKRGGRAIVDNANNYSTNNYSTMDNPRWIISHARVRALTRSSRGDRETETVPADLLEAIFT